MSERSHRDDRLIKHLLKENMEYRAEVDKLDYDVKYWKQQTLTIVLILIAKIWSDR